MTGVLVLALTTGCSDPSVNDAFCAQVEAVKEAGPLFPARTDGEPVPDGAALEAIRGLADHRPDAIADDIGVLVEAAEWLSDQAQQRMDQTTQGEPPDGRWSRSAVESAQRAVTQYAAEICEVDLTESQG